MAVYKSLSMHTCVQRDSKFAHSNKNLGIALATLLKMYSMYEEKGGAWGDGVKKRSDEKSALYEHIQ